MVNQPRGLHTAGMALALAARGLAGRALRQAPRAVRPGPAPARARTPPGPRARPRVCSNGGSVQLWTPAQSDSWLTLGKPT